MNFKDLKIQNWRQFSDVSIEFHPRLTVISGANGAGKSTLLRMLAQHFGYNNSLLATPKVDKSGVRRFISGFFGKKTDPNIEHIGNITYADGQSSHLIVPSNDAISYSVNIANVVSVLGLFIGSHRPTSNYQAISAIPANGIGAEQAYQQYNQEILAKYNNAFTTSSPIYRMKEAIVSMATFGPGNENVAKNDLLKQYYDDFKTMLRTVLPESIGFEDINIRMPDIVIVTKTGEFVLDSSSGGLMALIDLAWQLFLYSRGKASFVAVIDEPENHLHPSMQRTILPNLLKAFPHAQFIVATHSPFVVSSVRDSSVYVLRYTDGIDKEGPSRTVYSQKLDNVNKAGTASEILRSVLGVPVTLPLWAEDDIEKIAQDFDMESLTAPRISELRERLNTVGLGEFYSDALTRIAHRK